MSAIVGSSPLGTGTAAEEAGAGYDARFEFDAPRFHDFKQGSPAGEALDGWFHTSATAGLATPETGYCYNVNQKDLEALKEATAEEAVIDPASKQEEASQVRMVLAHIANNVVSNPQVQQPTKPALALSATAAPPPAATVVEKEQKKPAAQPPKPKQSSAKKTAPKQKAAPSERSDTEPEQLCQPVVPKPVQATVTEIPANTIKPGHKTEESIRQKTHETSSSSAVAASKQQPPKAVVVVTTTTTRTAATKTTAQVPPRPTRVAAKAIVEPLTRPTTRSSASISSKPAGESQSRPQQQTTKRPASASTSHRPRITVPHSPMLLSRQRSAMHQQRNVKTSEQLEMEEIERGKKQADRLRKLNAKTVRSVLTKRPRPVKHSTKPLTEPAPPQLRTSIRNRLHGMETRSMEKAQKPKRVTTTKTVTTSTAIGVHKRPASASGTSSFGGAPKPLPASTRQAANVRPKLTLPKTPKFATKARLRPSRFKPTEEEEVEKLKALPKFRARPVSKQVLEGRGRVAEPPVNAGAGLSKKALTIPQPFSFATDARAAKKQATHQSNTHPAPFVFGNDLGPRMTRSRARSLASDKADESPPVSVSYAATNPSSTYGGRKHTRSTSRDEEEERQQQQQQEHQQMNKRRRTTAFGPFLQGGAVRVNVETGKAVTRTMRDVEESDGIQDVFKGQTSHAGGATLHNPLFQAM